MPTPGLLLVFSKPKLSFDEETYNKWYSTIHIQDVVRSGLSDVAVRYKNTDPKAKWPYLAFYRLPDVAKMQDEAVLGSIPVRHELVPDGKPWQEHLEADMRPFVLLQKFEGQIPKDGPRGKILRTVFVEPGEGGDEDFDDWYRKQHLDMLSMVPYYRRSTRYKLADPTNEAGNPRFLACHEWDSANYPQESIKLVTGTEWSKRVLGAAKKFEGDVWEEIAATGATDSKL